MSRIASPLFALLIAACMLGAGRLIYTDGHVDAVRLLAYPAILVGVALSFAAYLALASRSSEDGKLPLLLLLSIYAEGAWVALLTVLCTIVLRSVSGYERVLPEWLLYALVTGVAVTILVRGVVLFVGSFWAQDLLYYRVRSIFFRRRR